MYSIGDPTPTHKWAALTELSELLKNEEYVKLEEEYMKEI